MDCISIGASFRSFIEQHSKFHKRVDVSRFIGPVLGYVTPWCVEQTLRAAQKSMMSPVRSCLLQEPARVRQCKDFPGQVHAPVARLVPDSKGLDWLHPDGWPRCRR